MTVIQNSDIQQGLQSFFTEPCNAGQLLDEKTGCKKCPEDHWSESGNTDSFCTACSQGKGVAAGQGKQESDCTWSKQFF